MLNHKYLLKIYRHYYNQVDIVALLAEEEESEGIDVNDAMNFRCSDAHSSDSNQDTTELPTVSNVLDQLNHKKCMNLLELLNQYIWTVNQMESQRHKKK